MSADPAPLEFHAPLAEEDEARAGHYALLARLCYAGPDAALLRALAGADGAAAEGQSELARAWKALAAAAGAAHAEEVAREYDEVFVGTGKAPVTPYATHYLAETGREKILVKLKSELAALGLARVGSAREPEDHMASLLEVMRYLISQEAGDVAAQKQKQFFERFLAPSYSGFCAAIETCDRAGFYKHVGGFMRAFFVVETEVLKMF